MGDPGLSWPPENQAPHEAFQEGPGKPGQLVGLVAQPPVCFMAESAQQITREAEREGQPQNPQNVDLSCPRESFVTSPPARLHVHPPGSHKTPGTSPSQYSMYYKYLTTCASLLCAPISLFLCDA